MKFTIFGSSGYIGSNVIKKLSSQGHELNCPDRSFWLSHVGNQGGVNLNNVIYCIGMTANFRTNLTGTIDAHVTLLNHIFKYYKIDSITYLSSTRVYENSPSTAEKSNLTTNPSISNQVYNISKLTAEALCLAMCPKAKIIRLSNVYGNELKTHNFLSSVLSDAVNHNKVTFLTSDSSSKDYIHIDDVAQLISEIAAKGKSKIYNVASGENTTNKTISDYLLTQNVSVDYAINAPEWAFKPIDITTIRDEFGFNPIRLKDTLPKLYDYFYLRSKNEPNRTI